MATFHTAMRTQCILAVTYIFGNAHLIVQNRHLQPFLGDTFDQQFVRHVSSEHTTQVNQSLKNAVINTTKNEPNLTINMDSKLNQANSESKRCLHILAENSNNLTDSLVHIAHDANIVIVDSFMESLDKSCTDAIFSEDIRPFDMSCGEALAWDQSSQLKKNLSSWDIDTWVNKTLSHLSKNKLSLLERIKEEGLSLESNDIILKIFKEIEQPVIELNIENSHNETSLLDKTLHSFKNLIHDVTNEFLFHLRKEVGGELNKTAKKIQLSPKMKTVTEFFLNNGKDRLFQNELFSEMIPKLVKLTADLKNAFVKRVVLDAFWIDLALYVNEEKKLSPRFLEQISGMLENYQKKLVETKLHRLNNMNISENSNQSFWVQLPNFSVPIQRLIVDSRKISQQLFDELKKIPGPGNVSAYAELYGHIFSNWMKTESSLQKEAPSMIEINFWNANISFNTSVLGQQFENVFLYELKKCSDEVSPDITTPINSQAELNFTIDFEITATKNGATSISNPTPNPNIDLTIIQNTIEMTNVTSLGDLNLTGNSSFSSSGPNANVTSGNLTITMKANLPILLLPVIDTATDQLVTSGKTLITNVSYAANTNISSENENSLASSPLPIIFINTVQPTPQNELLLTMPSVSTPVPITFTSTVQLNPSNEFFSTTQSSNRSTTTLPVTIPSELEENTSITNHNYTTTRNVSFPVSTKSLMDPVVDICSSKTISNCTMKAGAKTNQTLEAINLDSAEANPPTSMLPVIDTTTDQIVALSKILNANDSNAANMNFSSDNENSLDSSPIPNAFSNTVQPTPQNELILTTPLVSMPVPITSTSTVQSIPQNESFSTMPNPNRNTSTLPVTILSELEENTNITNPNYTTIAHVSFPISTEPRFIDPVVNYGFGDNLTGSSGTSSGFGATSTSGNSTIKMEVNPSISTPPLIDTATDEFVALNNTTSTNDFNAAKTNISLENEKSLVSSPIPIAFIKTFQLTPSNEFFSTAPNPNRNTTTLPVAVSSELEENTNITNLNYTTATNVFPPVSTKPSLRDPVIDDSKTKSNHATDIGAKTNQTSVTINPIGVENHATINDPRLSTSGGQFLYPFKYLMMFALIIYHVMVW